MKVASESFYSSFSGQVVSVNVGSFSEIKPSLSVATKINNRFAALEHSLTSLAEHVDMLAKRLETPELTVSQLSSECQPLVIPLSQNQRTDIVISEGSGVATGDKTVVRAVVFDSSVIGKMENTLKNLAITVMGFLAKIDNAGLRFATCNVQSINVPAKQKDIVCWHIEFDKIKIFSSGLDKGFLGAGVAIILNNSLACHVTKIEKVSGYLISIWLFFKGKLLVAILILYAEASAKTKFMLDGDFNENGSKKNASFKSCSNLDLVNSFSRHLLVKAFTWNNSKGTMKVIDYIFVNESLSSAMAGHKVIFVFDFFDTDHNAVIVSISLGGLLDVNRDCWKFKIKDANDAKWLCYRDCSFARLLRVKDRFFVAVANNNLDLMWSLLKGVMVESCSRNKWSSKFLGLELLVVKIVKRLSSNNILGFDNLVKKWLILDTNKAFIVTSMVQAGEKQMNILKHLSLVKRKYKKSNMYKSRLAEKTFKNNFKVATTPDTTTLEYYQSIYTHCKQRFNIPDGIKVVKKSVYQYIENRINNYFFGNYNISEVRSNLYNNLVHYSQLGTENLNSETLATYFQELNFNIIKYCEETYPVQSQYSIDFESETETNNKNKQKLKQYSKTTTNTLILPKTTAKHLQTPEQGTSSKLPLTITPFPASLVQAQTPNLLLNQFARLEDFTSPRSPTRQQKPLQTTANEENDSEISEKKSIDSENKEDKMTAYIAKISEFNGKDIETSPQEWLNQVTKAGDANRWNAARMLRTIPYFLKGTVAFKTAFLEQFTDNNTSITLRNCFCNIKQEIFKSVMTYIGKFNKLLRQICQLETNNYYSNAQVLDQFIDGLKDKLIKKICPHAPEDLNSAIQHAKRYEMAMEEANHTKLVNLAIGETSSVAEEKIDQLTKKVENYFTNQQQQQLQRYQPPQRWNQNNFISSSNNQPQNCHYCGISGHWKRDCKKLQQDQQNRTYYSPRPQYQTDYYQPALQPIQQQYRQPIQHYQVPARKLPRPSHYYTQLSYLTIPEKQDFYHPALSEGRAAAQQQNPSYTPTTIPPTRIAENANLSDIFPFEFKANESLFLFSNAAANEQKAITVMYTEAKIEGIAICLILDSGSTGSIITYQLIQQLKKNVDQPAQTVIITTNGMKKTSVEEIDNFPFTLDGITILVKVLIINTLQYQALVGNDWLQKANAKLDWETQKLQLSY
ncbi:hypothetical protein G9A89_016098 [Geosiphon pyriformis]|nr:hypothetical protein G9A89_016098 [Geosiphon pyriformis]